MTDGLSKVIIHIDGGARGNPGPAASGVVIGADDGTVLFQGGFYLGRATNNVAEYTGLLEGLKQAAKMGAKSVEIVSDSELLVRQMKGQYRVKAPGLIPLHMEARGMLNGFAKHSFRHVMREDNVDADRMVNQAIDQRRNVID